MLSNLILKTEEDCNNNRYSGSFISWDNIDEKGRKRKSSFSCFCCLILEIEFFLLLNKIKNKTFNLLMLWFTGTFHDIAHASDLLYLPQIEGERRDKRYLLKIFTFYQGWFTSAFFFLFLS